MRFISSLRKFINNLKLAQEKASKLKKKVELTWRGYTQVVEPSGGEFTSEDFQQKLLITLQEILKIHDLPCFPEPEHEVFLKLKKNVATTGIKEKPSNMDEVKERERS